MNELFKKYEEEFQSQMFSVNKELSESNLSEHSQLFKLKKSLYETEKSLKQMELEVAMMPLPTKIAMQAETRKFRAQWQDFMNSLKNSEKQFYDTKNQFAIMGSFVSEDATSSSSQSLRLQESVHVVSSSQDATAETLNNLKKQREQIDRVSEGSRDLKSCLVNSDKLESSIRRRRITNKFMMLGIFFLLMMTIVIVLYLNF